jgi:hypothetical protein
LGKTELLQKLLLRVLPKECKLDQVVYKTMKRVLDFQFASESAKVLEEVEAQEHFVSCIKGGRWD